MLVVPAASPLCTDFQQLLPLAYEHRDACQRGRWQAAAQAAVALGTAARASSDAAAERPRGIDGRDRFCEAEALWVAGSCARSGLLLVASAFAAHAHAQARAHARAVDESMPRAIEAPPLDLSLATAATCAALMPDTWPVGFADDLLAMAGLADALLRVAAAGAATTRPPKASTKAPEAGEERGRLFAALRARRAAAELLAALLEAATPSWRHRVEAALLSENAHVASMQALTGALVGAAPDPRLHEVLLELLWRALRRVGPSAALAALAWAHPALVRLEALQGGLCARIRGLAPEDVLGSAAVLALELSSEGEPAVLACRLVSAWEEEFIAVFTAHALAFHRLGERDSVFEVPWEVVTARETHAVHDSGTAVRLTLNSALLQRLTSSPDGEQGEALVVVELFFQCPSSELEELLDGAQAALTHDRAVATEAMEDSRLSAGQGAKCGSATPLSALGASAVGQPFGGECVTTAPVGVNAPWDTIVGAGAALPPWCGSTRNCGAERPGAFQSYAGSGAPGSLLGGSAIWGAGAGVALPPWNGPTVNGGSERPGAVLPRAGFLGSSAHFLFSSHGAVDGQRGHAGDLSKLEFGSDRVGPATSAVQRQSDEEQAALVMSDSRGASCIADGGCSSEGELPRAGNELPAVPAPASAPARGPGHGEAAAGHDEKAAEPEAVEEDAAAAQVVEAPQSQTSAGSSGEAAEMPRSQQTPAASVVIEIDASPPKCPSSGGPPGFGTCGGLLAEGVHCSANALGRRVGVVAGGLPFRAGGALQGAGDASFLLSKLFTGKNGLAWQPLGPPTVSAVAADCEPGFNSLSGISAAQPRARGYAALATGTLRTLCKARGLASAGSREELIAQLTTPAPASAAPPAPRRAPRTALAVRAVAPAAAPVARWTDAERGQTRASARLAMMARQPQMTKRTASASSVQPPDIGPTVSVAAAALRARDRRAQAAAAAELSGAGAGGEAAQEGPEAAILRVLEDAARLAREVAEVQRQFRDSEHHALARGCEAGAFLDDIDKAAQRSGRGAGAQRLWLLTSGSSDAPGGRGDGLSPLAKRRRKGELAASPRLVAARVA